MKILYRIFQLFLEVSAPRSDFNQLQTFIIVVFRRWLCSHASNAVAFSDLVIMNMRIAGTQGP